MTESDLKQYQELETAIRNRAEDSVDALILATEKFENWMQDKMETIPVRHSFFYLEVTTEQNETTI